MRGRKGDRGRKGSHALVKLRVASSTLAIAAFALLFIIPASSFPGLSGSLGGLLPRLQFLPALVALASGGWGLPLGFALGALALVLATLALTLVFGRLYCSFLCPLGALQDGLIHLGKLVPRHPPAHFRHRPSSPLAQAAVFLLILASALAGSTFLLGILEPWSAFGKVASSLLRPLALLTNNAAAALAKAGGSYALAHVDIGWEPGQALAAVGILAVLAILAISRGRLFCELLCPTGFLLRLASRHPLVGLRIEGRLCTSCGSCAAACRSSCIDVAGGLIDESRCVRCFDCLGACPTGAIGYSRRGRVEVRGPRREGSGDPGRRAFLREGGFVAGGAILAVAAASGLALGAAGRRRDPRLLVAGRARKPAAPPGAGTIARFLGACTSCLACVSVCPSGVLRPSTLEWGWQDLAKPYLAYDRAYCQFECALCFRTCPTAALREIPLEAKKRSRLGRSVLDLPLCIVVAKGTSCGACAEHCPTGALTMIIPATPLPGRRALGLPAPVVDEDYCVGCGACETVCPTKPEKAIRVEGREVQDEGRVRSRRPGDERDVQAAAPPVGALPEGAAYPSPPEPSGAGESRGDFPF